MKRSPSRRAQYTFDVSLRLLYLSHHSSLPVRLLTRIANKFLRRLAKRCGENHTVVAHLYGRSMTVPAEHPLAAILVQFPQYNLPLGLAAETLAVFTGAASSLAVIDVGANVGETIEIIEQRCPDVFSYLCVEADRDIADLCAFNHAGNDRVLVENRFIGEKEGAAVILEDDGRANPSVRLSGDLSIEATPSGGRLVRLDTLARSFAQTHGTISLLKVDTEGYDFSVLRSARELLTEYKPAIFFEWYPKLLLDLGEEVWGGFEYLAALGYHYFIFYTGRGDYYCLANNPDRFFLRSLASIALHNDDIGYFDVFAATQEKVCHRLVDASIAALEDRKIEQQRHRYVL